MQSCSWWVPVFQDLLVADGRCGRDAHRSRGQGVWLVGCWGFFVEFFFPFYRKKSGLFKSFAFSLVLTI